MVDFFVNKISLLVCILYILFLIGWLVYIDFSEYTYYGYGRYYRNQYPGCITFSAIALAVVCTLWWLITSYPLVTIPVAIGIVILCVYLYKLYNRTDHKGRIGEYERTVNEYISCLEKYESLVSEYLTFHRMPIPDDCEIKRGLPVNKGVSIGYGDKFTVYQSCNGGKVHTVRGCCSVFDEKHIYNFKQYRDFDSMLCKKCSSDYSPPDMYWYENYLQYVKLLRDIFDLYDKRAEAKEEVIRQRKNCNKFSIKLILMFDRQSRKRLKEVNKLLLASSDAEEID